MSIKAFFTPEWIWRHVIAAAMVASLFLNSHYVTKEEYLSDKKELAHTLGQLNQSIIGFNLSLELLKQTAGQLGDHEMRIRALEQRK